MNVHDSFELTGAWWHANGIANIAAAKERLAQGGMLPMDTGLALMQDARDHERGSDADHACLATLTYSPEEGPRIRLLGASQLVFATGDPFTLHGLTEAGRPVSLLDCFPKNLSISGAGFADLLVTGGVLVHGVHVTSLDDAQGDRLSVGVDGLRELLTTAAHGTDGRARPGLGRQDPAEISVACEDGSLTFRVFHEKSRSQHIQSTEVHADACVQLTESLSYLEWMERWVKPLERLIWLGTRAPGRLTSLCVWAGDIEGQSSAIDVISKPSELLLPTPKERKHMLASYAALGEAFPAFIAGWWQLHRRMAGTADFLFGALTSRMHLEPRLVQLTAVAEAYNRIFASDFGLEAPVTPEEHALAVEAMLGALQDPAHQDHYRRRLRYADEPTQEERLRAVIERAGQVVPAFGQHPGRLSVALSETRNYFIHLPAERPAVLEGAALWEATNLLALILECNLLLDSGLSSDHAAAVVAGSYDQTTMWGRLQRRGAAWPQGLGARRDLN